METIHSERALNAYNVNHFIQKTDKICLRGQIPNAITINIVSVYMLYLMLQLDKLINQYNDLFIFTFCIYIHLGWMMDVDD